MQDLQTPERILATAESMFAEQGYGAVSLRSITRTSGVNIAAIHYHFGSKQELLEQIFAKRCGPMNAERLRLLAECADAPGRPPLLEQILEAYLRPSMIWPGDPDGARRFLRLRAVLSHEQEVLARDLISRHFNDVSRRFAAPELSEEEVYWRVQFLLAAQYYTLSNPGRIAILSDGLCDPSDTEAALRHMVPFCAAVFRAPVPGPGVAERFRSLKPSATVEMSERVRAARAAGRRIIALSSGDPSLPTDPRIIEAAERALRAGATHYSSPAGEPVLREAIARRELERSGVAYDPADIIVTPGGKFALLTGLMGIVGPGDEVLIPQPGWVSYGPCIRLCGGTPRPIEMLDVVDVEAIERTLTPSTRAVILNSPVNPTGRVLSAHELRGVVELARRHGLWIIFDQVYADLVYSGLMSYPQAIEGGFERTLVVDSLSKSFGMTGWRLGYLAMPPGLSHALVKFIQHSIYCVPPFIQAAGARALELSGELLPHYRALFRPRMQQATASLTRVDGISCALPSASFFLFPRVAGDEVAIARRWLDELDVAVLPGTAFGEAGAGHLRLSMTCSDEELETALDRIVRAGLGA
jgi:aspartate aminotransferase